ncbi:MAG: hypothetical protein NVSMB12_14310 [Acidimicrobiales bacterium]
MYVRANTVTGAKDIDTGVSLVRDKVVPVLKEQKGYRGLTISADRDAGEVGILSLWDSLADLDASDSAIGKLRQEVVAAMGGSVTVTKMEQIVAEVGSEPPSEGCSLRIIEITMDPAIVDQQIAFFRENIVPELKATAGFRLVRLMVDRAAGKGMVGSVWADEASMRAADAAAEERRVAAKGRGVEISDPRYRKILFSQIS